MPKLTLFSPTPPDLSAFGVRSLQATLKAKGHDVRLVLNLCVRISSWLV